MKYQLDVSKLGCIAGEIPQLLLNGRDEEAYAVAKK